MRRSSSARPFRKSRDVRAPGLRRPDDHGEGGTSHEDQREAWYQARKIHDVKLDLPEGVVGPIFNDEYGDVTGLLYAVKGDGIASGSCPTSRRREAPALKVPMVKKVDIYESRRRRCKSSSRTTAGGTRRDASHDAEAAQPEQRACSGQVDTKGDRVMVP